MLNASPVSLQRRLTFPEALLRCLFCKIPSNIRKTLNSEKMDEFLRYPITENEIVSKTAHGCSSQEDEIRSAARRNETQPRTISRGSQDGSTRRNVQQRAPIRLSLDLEFQPRRRDTNQETQRRSDPESFQYFLGETSNLLLVAQPPDAQATPSPNDSGGRTAEVRELQRA